MLKNLFPHLKAPTVRFSQKSKRFVIGQESVASVRKSAKVDSERWITIGGKEDEGHGVHVKISGDGKIVAGPSGLADKGIRSLSDFGKAKDDDRKHVTAEHPRQSLRELQIEHKAKHDEVDRKLDETTKQLQRDKAKAGRNKDKADAIDRQWHDAKDAASKERQAISEHYRPKIQSHPEYIEQQNKDRESVAKRKEEESKTFAENNANLRREQWDHIQATGGYEEAKKNAEENLRQLQIRHNRTNEKNRFKLPSLDRHKREIEHIEGLNKEFGSSSPTVNKVEGKTEYESPQLQKNREIVAKLNAGPESRKLTPKQAKEKEDRSIHDKLTAMPRDQKHELASSHGIDPSKYSSDYNLHREMASNPELRSKLAGGSPGNEEANKPKPKYDSEFDKQRHEMSRAEKTKEWQDRLNKKPDEPTQPHEMSFYDYNRSKFGDKSTNRFDHKQSIEAAIKEGKTVPDNVLADYPDLQNKYGKEEGKKPAAGPSEVSSPAKQTQEKPKNPESQKNPVDKPDNTASIMSGSGSESGKTQSAGGNEMSTEHGPRIVPDSEYRKATKEETQKALDLAQQVASSIGVSPDVAKTCAILLERPVRGEGDDMPGKHTWTPESRLAEFTKKAKEMQALHDKNTGKPFVPESGKQEDNREGGKVETATRSAMTHHELASKVSEIIDRLDNFAGKVVTHKDGSVRVYLKENKGKKRGWEEAGEATIEPDGTLMLDKNFEHAFFYDKPVLEEIRKLGSAKPQSRTTPERERKLDMEDPLDRMEHERRNGLRGESERNG